MRSDAQRWKRKKQIGYGFNGKMKGKPKPNQMSKSQSHGVDAKTKYGIRARNEMNAETSRRANKNSKIDIINDDQ